MLPHNWHERLFVHFPHPVTAEYYVVEQKPITTPDCPWDLYKVYTYKNDSNRPPKIQKLKTQMRKDKHRTERSIQIHNADKSSKYGGKNSRMTYRLSRIVAIALAGRPPRVSWNESVSHINDDYTDNSRVNLELASPIKQIRRSLENGRSIQLLFQGVTMEGYLEMLEAEARELFPEKFK